MMNAMKQRFAGQCHCGKVLFEATLSDGFRTVRRCTCSYCRMRGAVAVSAFAAFLFAADGLGSAFFGFA